MKKIIIIFTLLTLSNILIAQDSTHRVQLGVNGFYSYSGFREDLEINASFVVSYDRHTINAGIFLAPDLDFDQEGYKPGFQFGYQIYPNKKQKTFNSFVAYDIYIIKAKIKDGNPTRFYYNDTNCMAMETLSIFNIEQYIGYGLKINFLKHYYFTSSIGVGCGWYQSEHIYECDDGQTRKYGGNKFYFSKPYFICKAGLGINFWPWKKSK